MKHPYNPECRCKSCQREGQRRESQSLLARAAEIASGRRRRGTRTRWAREYMDAFDSGRPMSSDDY